MVITNILNQINNIRNVFDRRAVETREEEAVRILNKAQFEISQHKAYIIEVADGYARDSSEYGFASEKSKKTFEKYLAKNPMTIIDSLKEEIDELSEKELLTETKKIIDDIQDISQISYEDIKNYYKSANISEDREFIKKVAGVVKLFNEDRLVKLSEDLKKLAPELYPEKTLVEKQKKSTASVNSVSSLLVG